MKSFLTIWRREITGCFLSPVAYVTMVAFLFLTGVTFIASVLSNVGTAADPVALLFAGVLLWMTFLITVVSMRLFAEENRSGTIETLVTAPVREMDVVLGKYAGGLCFVWLAMVPALLYLVVLSVLDPAMKDVDWGAVGSGVIILAMLSSFCLALGLLVSITTRNQIVAAICTFCLIWFVLLFGWLVSVLPVGLDWMAEPFNAMTHLEEFARGVIDLRPVAFYLSGTAFVLFVAIRLFEWRRWR